MADQQSRGGKKEGAHNPDGREKQQHVRDESERPAPGQPGGPKQNAGKSREGHQDTNK